MSNEEKSMGKRLNSGSHSSKSKIIRSKDIQSKQKNDFPNAIEVSTGYVQKTQSNITADSIEAPRTSSSDTTDEDKKSTKLKRRSWTINTKNTSKKQKKLPSLVYLEQYLTSKHKNTTKSSNEPKSRRAIKRLRSKSLVKLQEKRESPSFSGYRRLSFARLEKIPEDEREKSKSVMRKLARYRRSHSQTGVDLRKNAPLIGQKSFKYKESNRNVNPASEASWPSLSSFTSTNTNSSKNTVNFSPRSNSELNFSSTGELIFAQDADMIPRESFLSLISKLSREINILRRKINFYRRATNYEISSPVSEDEAHKRQENFVYKKVNKAGKDPSVVSSLVTQPGDNDQGLP